MNFQFATADQIIFGAGSLNQISDRLSEFGNKAFVITGSNKERALPLVKIFEEKGISWKTYSVTSEPTLEVVEEAVSWARKFESQFVIGIGGGSALDTGKVVAAMLSNNGDLVNYLEVVGKGLQIENTPLPYIAIPTTSGTGAEVTKNAVIDCPEHGVKVSMRSPMMIPTLAVVDSELTHSAPQSVTASTGMDALTQLIEAFISKKSNALTDGICRQGIAAARSLKTAYFEPENSKAREDMALASLFGGLALANAGLGAVHGFAGPFGGMFHAAHGEICAALLPAVLEVNLREIKAFDENQGLEAKFTELAQILTGEEKAAAEDGINWIKQLCLDLKIKDLKKLGLTEDLFHTLIEKSKNSSSMKGNPVSLSDEALTEILTRSSSFEEA